MGLEQVKPPTHYSQNTQERVWVGLGAGESSDSRLHQNPHSPRHLVPSYQALSCQPSSCQIASQSLAWAAASKSRTASHQNPCRSPDPSSVDFSHYGDSFCSRRQVHEAWLSGRVGVGGGGRGWEKEKALHTQKGLDQLPSFFILPHSPSPGVTAASHFEGRGKEQQSLGPLLFQRQAGTIKFQAMHLGSTVVLLKASVLDG